MNNRLLISKWCGWVLLTFAIAAPLSAHHSFAGYDMTKTLSATATIKEFRWGAPHSSAVYAIKGANGKWDEITIASAAPAMFVRQGFKPKDFRVGDTVQIEWHPTRAGNPGGIMATIKLPDGRMFKESEAGATQATQPSQFAEPPAK